jgi:hypothetical protein
MSDIQFNTGVIRPVECFKEGWEIVKPDFWLLLGIAFVGGLIAGATLLILAGAMYCGIFYCYLKKVDGQPLSFDDLWKGMNWWLPGLGVVAIIFVPIIVEYIFIYISLIGAIVAGANLGESETLGLILGALGVHFVILFAMVCFHTLLVFSFPLIVDRNLGAIAAMTTSARAVWQNLGGVVGLIGVQIVLVLLGEMACGIGLYFVLPIIIAGNMVAFRKVFPAAGNPGFNAPPAPFPGTY